MTSKNTVEKKVVAVNVPEEAKFAGQEGKCAICGKPLLGGKTGMGATCIRHIGKVGKFAQQAPENVATSEEYITLVKLCDIAQKLGRSRGFAVRLTGGDACTKSPATPAFRIFVHGRRKYVHRDAVKALEVICAPSKSK